LQFNVRGEWHAVEGVVRKKCNSEPISEAPR
jgi:hypothetical protein